MTLDPRPSAAAAGPPGAARSAGRLMPAAFALAALAALMGLRFYTQPPAPVASPAHVGGDVLTHVQVAVAALGMLLGGVAVYRARASASSLGLGAVLAFFSVIAVPPVWDSLRLLAAVLGLVSAAGAGLVLMPPVGRRLALSVLALVHFGGILVAVTSPSPQPWVSGQAWTRFYRPYLQFMYLNNAYHFYSPEPGPASLLWACLEWEEPVRDAAGAEIIDPATGKAMVKQHFTWFEFPKRPEDANDPMSVTYYRRLSCVEQINQMNAMQQGIPNDVAALRSMAATPARSDAIPYHPRVPTPQQYRPLSEASRRTQVPSYVRAVAEIARHNQAKLKARRAGATGEAAKRQPNEPADDWNLVALKLYRVEHAILTPEQFALPYGPDGKPYELYDPETYRPYFLGDYDTDGNLRDAKDGLLYWLVPVLRDESLTATGTGKPHWKFDARYTKNLRDFTMRHATGRFEEEEKP